MNDENQQPQPEMEDEEMQLDAGDGKDRYCLYIGTKIITACPMDELTFLRECKGQDVEDRENKAGYKVIYPDGYVSWSPRTVFEIAYREVTFGELALMK